MKAAELRELSTEEIRERLDEAREELMNLRFQQSTGELVDTSRIRIVRRDIARMLTVLRERELAAATEGEA
ncbi:MAG: 50S ribosomal protein L29 [Anaerolineae bacterium]|nr:MAG: 50S ribosomal protein L29 [Anaerolineae bacterium]